MSTYTYSVSTDFPNQLVNLDRLTQEIRQSSITIALDYINVTGDVCDIVFKAALSGPEVTTLNAIVAAHTGAFLDPAPTEVVLSQSGSTPNYVVISGSVGTPASVTGSVNVTNSKFPVTGTVNLDRGNSSAVPLFVTGTITTSTTIVGTQTVTGSVNVTNASFPVTLLGTGSVNVQNFPATQAISAVSLPLPTGAATETTLGTRLADSTFTGRINTQGQKTSAASTPVVLASDQSIIPVSGAFGVQDTAGRQVITGTITVSNAIFPTTGTVGLDRGTSSGNPLFVTSAPTGVQQVTGSVSLSQPAAITAASLPLPTGAATETTLGTRLADSTFTGRINTQGQKTMAASTPIVIASDQSTLNVALTGTGSITGSVSVSNSIFPVTGTVNLDRGNSTAVPLFVTGTITTSTTIVGTQTVTGSVNVTNASFPVTLLGTGSINVQNFPATQAISAASLPLPTGAATETTLGTRLADSTFTGRINTQGQKTMAASTPVVLASDQSIIPVSGAFGVQDSAGRQVVTGTITVSNATFPTTGTVGLDRGTSSGNPLFVTSAPTGVQQVTGSVSLSQPAAITATSLPLPSGAATETTLGTRLADSTFTGRINTQGQKTMAASTPVVLASDQSTLNFALTGTGSITGSVSVSNSIFPVTGTVGLDRGTSLVNPLFISGSITATPVGLQTITGSVNVTNASFPVTLLGTGSMNVQNFPASQAITAASLPLPTGAATETTLGTRLADSTFTGRINTQGQKTSAASTPVVLASDQSILPVTGTVAITGNSPANPVYISGSISATPSGTQTITGSVNVTNASFPVTLLGTGSINVQNFPATQAISAASLPLPTGAATETTLSTRLADSTFTGRINTQGQKTMATSTPVVLASDQSTLNVLLTGTGSITGSVNITNASFPVTLLGTGSVNVQNFPATQAISAASLPLPTGAATETTLSTRLADSTFTGRINTQGQKTMAASTPIVIASDQSTLPVSGAFGVQDSGGRQVVTGTITVSNSIFPVTGTVNLDRGNSLALPLIVSGNFGSSTGVVTGTVNLDRGNTSALPLFVSGAMNITNASFPVTLLGTGSVNVQNFPVTQAISAASLPLPTGAATETTLSTRLADSTFTGRINTLGQKTAANSTPVVLASDQSTLNVLLTGTGSITGSVNVSNSIFPVTGTVNLDRGNSLALPLIVSGNFGSSTGAVTGTVNLDRGNTAALPLFVSGAMNITNASFPVTLLGTGSVNVQNFPASQAITAASLPLPTGAATETTLSTRLADSTFTGRINTLGQKTSAASTPVVLASDQSTLNVALTGTGSITGSVNITNTLFPVTGTIAIVGQGTSALNPLFVSGNFGGTGTQTVTGSVNVTNTLFNITGSVGITAPITGVVSISNFPATQSISATALPLPTGATTETTLSTRLADSTFTGRINTLGQKTMAASTPVVLASDQLIIPVSGAFGVQDSGGHQVVTGTITVSNATFPTTGTVNLDRGNSVALPLFITSSGAVNDGGGSLTVDSPQLPAALVGGRLDANIGTWLGSTAPTVGSKTSANSVPVVIASDQGAVSVTGSVAITGQGTTVVAPLWITGTVTTTGGTGGGTVNQGTAGSAANGWFEKITDGTNVAAVKAASTAAIATDPALVVAISPNNPISVSAAADTTATGSFTSTAGVLSFGGSAAGQGSAVVQLAGTFSATITFEGTVDGANWVAITGRSTTSTLPSSTATAAGIYRFSLNGLKDFRARCSAYTSGTVVVAMRESTGDTVGATEISPTVITTPLGSQAGLYATTTGYGYLRTTIEPAPLFNDCFDGTVIDTTDRWTTATIGSALLTQVSSSLTFTIGIPANNAASVSTKPLFGSNIGVALFALGLVIKMETIVVTGQHKFWGIGTQPGTWTALLPLQDAIGFEQDTTGALNAVVYAGGTRTIAAVLSRPSDGAFHRYTLVFRNDVVIWYVDTTEVPVASLSYPQPVSSVLPIRLHSINGTSTLGGIPTFQCMALGAGDTGHSSNAISDGALPWRKATVKPASTAAVATDQALVVAISPNNALSVASPTSSTSTISSVASSASTTSLLASNGSRKGMMVFNEANRTLYLKYGATASLTSYTVQIPSKGYWEMSNVVYTGAIDGIWDASPTGSVRITELT